MNLYDRVATLPTRRLLLVALALLAVCALAAVLIPALAATVLAERGVVALIRLITDTANHTHDHDPGQEREPGRERGWAGRARWEATDTRTSTAYHHATAH